jgi:restriction system protein
MDLTSITSQFISGIWYFIPIFIIIFFIKTPWFKGWFGESIVNFFAWFSLNKNIYHRIPNVTLPAEAGTTQIDHIIVSVYGVFVVETKNLKGWIFGSPHQKTWTQKIFRHTKTFQNPLHQNYKHVKTLQSLLSLKDEQIHDVVVFIGDSTFKIDMPENVAYGSGYIKFIKSKKQQVISESEVQEIKEKIQNNRLARSFETVKVHINNVRKIIDDKAKKSTGIPDCPRCGRAMVLREVKKGINAGKTFWGCEKFPRCRGLIDSNNKLPNN